MNAIELLKEQHRSVEELFSKLEGASSRGKDGIAEKILRELTIHTVIEERAFYPNVRKLVPPMTKLVLQSVEEHTMLKWEIASLALMDSKDERFDAKMKILKELFMRHMEEEEHELFPKVQKALSASKLAEIGEALDQAQTAATTGRGQTQGRAASPWVVPGAPKRGTARSRPTTQTRRSAQPTRTKRGDVRTGRSRAR